MHQRERNVRNPSNFFYIQIFKGRKNIFIWRNLSLRSCVILCVPHLYLTFLITTSRRNTKNLITFSYSALQGERNMTLSLRDRILQPCVTLHVSPTLPNITLRDFVGCLNKLFSPHEPLHLSNVFQISHSRLKHYYIETIFSVYI